MAFMLTPNNEVTREQLIMLLRDNIMNNLYHTCSPDVMETDSPVRKPTSLQPVSKKLFHSPAGEGTGGPAGERPEGPAHQSHVEHSRRTRKRKQILVAGSSEGIEHAYIEECDKDGYSPEVEGGIRKKMLISLFHNKEYSMELDS